MGKVGMGSKTCCKVGLPKEEETKQRAWVGLTSESRTVDDTGSTLTPCFPLKVYFLNKYYVTAYLPGFLLKEKYREANFQYFKVSVS